MSKRFQLIGAFLAVSVLAAAIAIMPYYLNNWFLTTPDAGGLACGAKTLATTGHFSDGQTASLGYNFNICWTRETYPALQVILAGILRLAPTLDWLVVPLTSIAAFVAGALGLQWLSWRLTRSISTAVITGMFASTALMALRALILTPQNIFGYTLIIYLLIILHELHVRQRWWLWLLGAVTLLMLGTTHTLSFGIGGIMVALWFTFMYEQKWPYRLGLIAAASIAAVGLIVTNILPWSLTEIWSLFHGSLSGYDHPLYDHPAIWGYGLTSLAAIGIFISPRVLQLEKKTYRLLLVLLLVAVLLGHAAWFGLTLLPDRFIAFTWISITLFAGLGFTTLQQRLRLPRPIQFAFMTLLLGAQLVHAITYSKDDVVGWSSRFQPREEFITALSWLNQQPNRGTLVGIMAVANREITFAPMWYDGAIASYPWYNLNHKNIKSFKANSTLYQAVFADPTSQEYLRVQAFYTMITKPNSVEAKTAALQYNLRYLILPIHSQADTIWQEASPEQFTLIYENNRYRIFQLQ